MGDPFILDVVMIFQDILIPVWTFNQIFGLVLFLKIWTAQWYDICKPLL